MGNNTETPQISKIVLILILMDVAQWGTHHDSRESCSPVLILILMDVAQWVYKSAST